MRGTERARAAGSVYDLIKKELVTLRVDANGLAATVQSLLRAQDGAVEARAQVGAHTTELASVWAAAAAVEGRGRSAERGIFSPSGCAPRG
jgi:hypothetical protein